MPQIRLQELKKTDRYGPCFTAMPALAIAVWSILPGCEKGEQKMEKKYWEDKEYSYFSHKKCEFFPCHKGADPEDFNCLFCYCPLYALGEKCGGNFRYTEKGIKDCTNCQLPHKRKNYGYVTGKYQELAALMQEIREREGSTSK